MGTYVVCPNCGNTEEGETIYRRNKCGKIFCESCDVRGGFMSGNELPFLWDRVHAYRWYANDAGQD